MRTKDRLDELRQLSGEVGVYHDTVLQLPAHQLHEELEQVLQEVDATHRWILELRSETQLIRRLHADPTYHTNAHLQEQLDSAVSRAHGTGLKVCGALRQLAGRAAGGGVAQRVARVQGGCARRRYGAALAELHAQLHALRDDRLQLLQQQVRLTNLTISDEECENLLDSNNISLFVDNVRAETAEARRALREAEARREELARVEAALREVRDLFVQVAYLVAQQQDQIDSVEYYALQATELVECGGQELLKGRVTRTKGRKKKLSLIICLASGFLLVLAVLVFT